VPLLSGSSILTDVITTPVSFLLFRMQIFSTMNRYALSHKRRFSKEKGGLLAAFEAQSIDYLSGKP
jgi:hypothetical protein